MRPRERYGTRYLGMSPRGGIAKPPEPHYSETVADCQYACGLARRGVGAVVVPSYFVVPANAGTYTPRPFDFERLELIPSATTKAGGYGSLLSQGRHKC